MLRSTREAIETPRDAPESLMKIAGCVAVVTGAGSGIGRATAEALAQAGARVHVADIRGDDADATARGIGGVAHVVDVTDADAVRALHDDVFGQDGRIDILHNNAGIAITRPIVEMTLEDWNRQLAVNLNGVIHGLHHFTPTMLAQGRGVIVNTASILGLIGVPFSAAYCASKFAIVGLSESADAELSPRGVRVLSVCPGMIDTNIVSRGKISIPGRTKAQLEAKFRTGARPEVVANAVIQAIEREQQRTLVPMDAKVMRFMRFLPNWAKQRIYKMG